jgi:hypothetical protein
MPLWRATTYNAPVYARYGAGRDVVRDLDGPTSYWLSFFGFVYTTYSIHICTPYILANLTPHGFMSHTPRGIYVL